MNRRELAEVVPVAVIIVAALVGIVWPTAIHIGLGVFAALILTLIFRQLDERRRRRRT